MATGGRREETDGKITAWERDLERLRVALANAPETVNAKHHPTFVELYRQKESVKSRWEAIRGVYQPDAEAVRRCEEALAAMEAAWARAEAMVTEVIPARAA
jgi:putative heme degradation protein